MSYCFEQALLPLYSSAQVKALEQEHAKAHGGHCYDLMELAGKAAVDELVLRLPMRGSIWIFAGKGNNGGDGYVAGRLLKAMGYQVRLFALGTPRAGTEAEQAAKAYAEAGGLVDYVLPELEDAISDPPDCIIDAILGTGLSSAPHEPAASWINYINNVPAFTLAIDVPSGLNADTGVAPGACVIADRSVCMLALKPGLFTDSGPDCAGEVVSAGLGVESRECYARFAAVKGATELPCYLCHYEDIMPALPVRHPSCHKGEAGRVLIAGGAQGYGGAAMISSMAALRSGAGLIKTAVAPCNVTALNARCPEIMSADLTSDEDFAAAAGWTDVLAIGPGLAQNELSRKRVQQAVELKKPVVFDADALNILAEGGIKLTGDEHVLTPHPGEAARLLNMTVSEVNSDRLHSAVLLQKRFGGVVLLKGAGTVITDGKILVIIDEGSASMASGGMGDALTGVIAALRAQGLSLMHAVVCGAAVHGRAGNKAARDGLIGTAATDLLPCIRRLVNGFSLLQEN